MFWQCCSHLLARRGRVLAALALRSTTALVPRMSTAWRTKLVTEVAAAQHPHDVHRARVIDQRFKRSPIVAIEGTCGGLNLGCINRKLDELGVSYEQPARVYSRENSLGSGWVQAAVASALADTIAPTTRTGSAGLACPASRTTASLAPRAGQIDTRRGRIITQARDCHHPQRRLHTGQRVASRVAEDSINIGARRGWPVTWTMAPCAWLREHCQPGLRT